MRRLLARADFAVALLVRLLVAAFGLAAILVPLPGFTTPAAILAVFALPLPLVAARWPDSPWVPCLVFVSIAEWVIAALFVGAAPLLPTVLYGGLLYLLHATAALAATLPMTRRVEPVLLARVALRLFGVVLVSTPLMIAVLLLPGRPGSMLLAGAGAVSALGVAALLVLLLQRRPAE
ncbi:MAG: hypothetical protein ABJA34_06935 [Pseudonocardiales bacterium]